jgi:hypothetical protein
MARARIVGGPAACRPHREPERLKPDTGTTLDRHGWKSCPSRCAHPPLLCDTPETIPGARLRMISGGYAAPMKNLRITSRLLSATTLLASLALGQTSEPQAPDSSSSSSSASIAIARCAYAPSDEGCTGSSQTETTLAQRTPGPGLRPRRPAMGRPYGGYRGGWASSGNGRHALIGAVIGFGLGAAVGAKANANQHLGQGPGLALGFGTVGGLLGAAFGSGIPSYHARCHYRRGPWPDEEDEGASYAKPLQPGRVTDPARTATTAHGDDRRPATDDRVASAPLTTP